MRVKEESERAGLKLNIKNAKITASGPLLHGKEKEKRWNLWQISSFWALKSLQMVTRAMKSENDCFLAGKL